jgi:hypothetical protein
VPSGSGAEGRGAEGRGAEGRGTEERRLANEPLPREGDDGITWITAPEAPRLSRAHLTLGGAVALAVLLVVAGVLALMVRQAHTQPDSAAAPVTVPQASAAVPVPIRVGPAASTPAAKSASSRAPAPPPANAGTISAPRLPAAATFEVAATAASVTVRSENLGTDLYRVTLAKAAGPVRAKVGDSGANHRLTLVKDPDTAAPPITVTLNAGVRWSLKLSAGNSQTSVNLRDSKLASVELAGGTNTFNLALPAPSGTLPLRVTHGMSKLNVDTHGAPIRVTVDAGTGKVIIDGETRNGPKPGTVLTSDGWANAADRVDLDAVAGLGTLTVDTD